MSRQAHMQTTLERISQLLRKAGLPFALADPMLGPCNSPLTPSPEQRSFAWQGGEADANHRRARLTHSLFLQPEEWRASANVSVAARPAKASVCRWPSGKCFHRAPSLRIFPAHPRSLARCFSRARRHSAFCFGYAALKGFGFQKIFCAKNAKKISRTFRKRHAHGAWERGTFTTPARRVRVLGDPGTRVASRKSVPRAIRGKSKQEKFQWHSTKTKSH